jgi:hypothetical protein
MHIFYGPIPMVFKKTPVACPRRSFCSGPVSAGLGSGRSDQNRPTFRKPIATRQNDLSLLRFEKRIYSGWLYKTAGAYALA